MIGRENLIVGWLGIFAGFVAGALPGLFFWMEDWLGGYGSWRRRLVRLAHISFFGLGFINILFALSVAYLGLAENSSLRWSSVLLVAGALAMPATPLYARLKAEGRLLADGDWTRCTLFDLNFTPKGMTGAELAAGFRALGVDLYSAAWTERRRHRFNERLKAQRHREKENGG